MVFGYKEDSRTGNGMEMFLEILHCQILIECSKRKINKEEKKMKKEKPTMNDVEYMKVTKPAKGVPNI